MKTYLSHLSAALYWDIPVLNVLFDEKELDERRNRQIIDITAVDPRKRSKKAKHKSYSCKLPLPRNATIRSGDIWIASPELVFLEFANKMDIQRLILLGLQMCCHPPGKATEAVSTKRRLKVFLDKSSGYFGHVKAERAVQYIENGSASIMESILFMILSLPYKLGGYGFRGVTLNHEIPLDAKSRKQLGQERCYADLYIAKSKLAIEYDSYFYHNSPKSHSKDSLRASALKRQGIDVIQLKTFQLYNEKAFDDFIFNLASRLGKRLKNNSYEFHAAHRNLRDLMPKDNLYSGTRAPTMKPSDPDFR